MCGIAALFAYHDAAPPVDRDELARVTAAMARRGPDGQGLWIAPDRRVGLGHRRLAIVDLSPGGAQPMSDESGDLVISFNGEIYNHVELRRQLEARGHRFRSRSDTEVLLRLYADRGDAMLAELRGMFAIALYDRRRDALLLARDPYGIKPLYFADDGWSVRAASQVKALIAGGAIGRDLDPAGIVGFHLFGSVPEPFTIYRSIQAVPPGQLLWIDRVGMLPPRPFASIGEALRRACARDAGSPHAVRRALADSVAVHLGADVPVGIFLSAGVDSGAVLALSRERNGADLGSVTVRFDDLQGGIHDEAALAGQMADRLGTRHHLRAVSTREFLGDLPGILEAMDQPTIDGVNTWFAAKAAREAGLRVMLSGMGGDELFGGYPSFRDLPRWVASARLPGALPGLGRGLRWLLTRRGTRRWPPKAAGFLEYARSCAGAYLLRRGLFMPWELPALLGEELAREGLRRLRPLALIDTAIDPSPPTWPGRVIALESSLYLRNQLLRDSDWASMAHSIELRVPLVDWTLLHHVAPSVVRCRERGKRPLAAVTAAALPAAITARAKTGFHVPMERWLQHEPALDAWRRQEQLTQDGCPWARRWASVIAGHWGLS